MIPTKAINLLIEMWPMLLLFVIVLITIRLTYIKVNKKKFVLYKELLSLSFIVYILLLFELVTSTDFESYSNNFIPFKEMFRYHLNSKLFYRNVIGNILIFVPFGYFISYYCKLPKVWYNLLITFITSFSIETIQSCIGRSFDIDDIILNVIGGLFGYLIYVITKLVYKKYSDTLKNNLLLNVICIIVIVTLSIIILNIYGVRLWMI